MKLGEKIRLLRILKGYTQESMADSLKLSVTGYGKIERDETNVTVSRISQIADVLNVKVEDILRSELITAFPDAADACASSFGQRPNYYGYNEALTSLKALYENRIDRLEAEVLEMRRLFSR